MVQTCLCFLWGQQNGYCNDHKNCIEIKIWTLSATEDRLGKNWSCVQLSKCCQKMQNSDLRAEIYIENLVGVAWLIWMPHPFFKNRSDTYGPPCICYVLTLTCTYLRCTVYWEEKKTGNLLDTKIRATHSNRTKLLLRESDARYY